MGLAETWEGLKIELPTIKIDGAMRKMNLAEASRPIIQIKELSFYYGLKPALKSINVDISEK